jgi:hypothetical protein
VTNVELLHGIFPDFQSGAFSAKHASIILDNTFTHVIRLTFSYLPVQVFLLLLGTCMEEAARNMGRQALELKKWHLSKFSIAKGAPKDIDIVLNSKG